MKAKTLPLFLLLALFYSCKEDRAPEDRSLLDQAKNDLISDYASRYNAMVADYRANFRDYQYTFQFQESIDKDSVQIIENFYISDIVKLDSTYMCTISKLSGHPSAIYKLRCSEDLKNALSGLKTSTMLNHHSFLVARLDSVRRLDFSLYPKDGYNEDQLNIIDVDISDLYIFEGSLIDVAAVE